MNKKQKVNGSIWITSCSNTASFTVNRSSGHPDTVGKKSPLEWYKEMVSTASRFEEFYGIPLEKRFFFSFDEKERVPIYKKNTPRGEVVYVMTSYAGCFFLDKGRTWEQVLEGVSQKLAETTEIFFDPNAPRGNGVKCQ
jgi:hypothetical protein